MNELFISKLRITKLQQIQNKLVDEYDIHQLVYKLFSDSDERSFLYFINYVGLGDLEISIQSSVEPSPNKEWNLTYRKVPNDFFENDFYSFKLRFSPTARHAGKAIRICSRFEDAVSWLLSRQQLYGMKFNRDTLEKTGQGVMRMPRPDRDRIVITYVDMVGELEVIDRDLFMTAVRKGIGPGKGFGLGLLQIRPIGGRNE